MAKYVLSFTPSLEDKKQLIVSYTQHTNVYNDNDYIVAFSPWSIYSAEIIDDMVKARKLRIKASKVFLKDGTIVNSEDGVIDQTLVKAKTGVGGSKVERLSNYKVMFDGRVIPSILEDGISVLKAVVDDEITSFLNSKEGNVIKLVESIQKKVTAVANNVGGEWYKYVSKGNTTKKDVARHLKNIYDALNSQKDPNVLSPFMFMNTQHTIGSLLYNEGYRSDKLTNVSDLNTFVIGDTIGSQINSLLLQGVYKATDVAINSYKLTHKMLTISDSTPYKSQSVLYSNDTLSKLEESSIVMSEISNRVGLDGGKVIFSTESTLKGLDTYKANPVHDSTVLPNLDDSKVSFDIESGDIGDLEGANLVKPIDSTTLPGIEKSKVVNSRNTVNDVSTERAKFISDRETSNVSELDLGKVVSPVKGIVTSLMENSKIVSDKATGRPMNLKDAIVKLDTLTSVAGLDKGKFSRTQLVKEVLKQGKAQLSIYASGGRIAETSKSIFIRDNSGSTINELDSLVFKINITADLSGKLEDSVTYNILEALAEASEYGTSEEGIVDVVLEFIKDTAIAESDVELLVVNYEESNSLGGSKDVELIDIDDINFSSSFRDTSLSVFEEFNPNDSYKDTFISVIGTEEYSPGYKDTNVSTLESLDVGSAGVDTYLEVFENFKRESSKTVQFDRIERTSDEQSSKKVEFMKVEGFNVSLSNLETLMEEFVDGDFSLTYKDTELGYADRARDSEEKIDVSISTLDDSYNAPNLKDIELSQPDTTVVLLDKLDVDLGGSDKGSLLQGDADVQLEKLNTSDVTEEVLDVDLNLLNMSSSKLDTLITDIQKLVTFKQDTETFKDVDKDLLVKTDSLVSNKDTDFSTLEEISFDKAVKDTTLDRMVKVVTDVAVKDVAKDIATKVDFNVGVKDTSLNQIESFDKEIEYEGQYIAATIHSDISPEVMAGTSDDLETYNKDVNIPINIAEPDSGEKSNKYIQIYESPTVTADSSSEIEGNLPNDTDKSELSKSVGIEIGGDIEDSDRWSSREVFIAEKEERTSSTTRSISISEHEVNETSSEIESEFNRTDVATPDGRGNLITIVESGNGILEKEIESDESQFDVVDKKAPNYFIQNTEQDVADGRKSVPVSISEGNKGNPEIEVESDPEGEGEGGTVVPKDPDIPITPKDPKQKIWSIMGKNYPSWQNWNPKKTR